MTALLVIDTEKKRVRRYVARRVGGRLDMTDEVTIVKDPDVDVLKAQLNQLRAGEHVPLADPIAPPEAA